MYHSWSGPRQNRDRDQCLSIRQVSEKFKAELSLRLRKVESGVFGADMRTEMSTDGPVTIVMDSKVLIKR